MRLSAAILLCSSALFLAVEGQIIGAITGLTAAQATIAGLAGVAGAIGVGGALGGLASALTGGRRGGGGGRSRGRSSGRRYYRRRGRRQIFQENEDAEEINVDEALQGLVALDVNDCGKRYLCQAAATPENQRPLTAQLSLDIFRGKAEKDTEDMAIFRSAVVFGYEAKNQASCITKYKKCALGKNFGRLPGPLDTETNLVDYSF